MYTVQLHGRGADLPFFLRFGYGPILVQINLQHSQIQPYAICTRGFNLIKLFFLCGSSYREVGLGYLEP